MFDPVPTTPCARASCPGRGSGWRGAGTDALRHDSGIKLLGENRRAAFDPGKGCHQHNKLACVPSKPHHFTFSNSFQICHLHSAIRRETTLTFKVWIVSGLGGCAVKGWREPSGLGSTTTARHRPCNTRRTHAHCILGICTLIVPRISRSQMVSSKVTTATIGFPRIGPNREMKKALESFWAGKSSEAELVAVARETERAAWQAQKDAGLDLVGLDSTLYDQILDFVNYLGLIPKRFLVGVFWGCRGCGCRPLREWDSHAFGGHGEAVHLVPSSQVLCAHP